MESKGNRYLFLKMGVIILMAFMVPGALSLSGSGAAAAPSSHWSAQSSGTDNALFAVSALDATHVWAVGDYGTILFYDGTSGSSQYKDLDIDFSAVSALDATHVWAVGHYYDNNDVSTNVVLFYNGTSWSVQYTSTVDVLLGVSALDATHVWAVGEDGILFYDGTTWSSQQTSADLRGVSALDTTHVWAVGCWGDILLYNGTSWQPQSSGVESQFYGVSALDAIHVWAVGEDGILFYDGTTWSSQQTSADLRGVSALDTTHVWAVGREGNILFYDGTSWSVQYSNTNYSFNSVSALDANHVWAVGWDGTILFYGPQSYTYYFAEGYTGAGFNEWLCLMNPGTSATTAHITYMFSDGTTQKQDVEVGATTRTTVNVNSVVGPDKSVSVEITSDGLIVAERPMYFNYNGVWTGGHDVIGATAPQTKFYFAEGYTGAGFDEWLCLMNPNSEPAAVEITLMFSDGSSRTLDGMSMDPTERDTVSVNRQTGPDKSVSVMITSDLPIVAERPMYFNYNGVWTGGHDVVGFTP